jgi:putative nucleotidyltransferase with HDIG domain
MALVTAVEAKDPSSEVHSLHVAAYAERLARLVGIVPAEVDVIVIAALLHDVGKIGIPDAILTKPGPLSVDEFAVVKQHPIVGEAILRPIGFLERELTLVRHHHEWYNGSGYPDGLAGDQIPLGARILQVADGIDAMISPRSYKPSRSIDEVMVELLRCRGTQFDPFFADTAVEWLRSCPYEVLSATSVPRKRSSHLTS